MQHIKSITFPKPAVSDIYFFLSTPDFTERVWFQLIPDWGAKKWQQNPKSPTPTHPRRPNLPVTLLWIGHPQRVRQGLLHSDERTETQAQRPNQRGGERRETNGSDGEEEEIEGETEKDFKNNNNKSKKTNNREKNKWEKRERSRRSSEAPKVLELIKMICIYLWALMSSFSIVCFLLIWIFPFHYVT